MALSVNISCSLACSRVLRYRLTASASSCVRSLEHRVLPLTVLKQRKRCCVVHWSSVNSGQADNRVSSPSTWTIALQWRNLKRVQLTEMSVVTVSTVRTSRSVTRLPRRTEDARVNCTRPRTRALRGLTSSLIL